MSMMVPDSIASASDASLPLSMTRLRLSLMQTFCAELLAQHAYKGFAQDEFHEDLLYFRLHPEGPCICHAWSMLATVLPSLFTYEIASTRICSACNRPTRFIAVARTVDNEGES